MDKKRGKLLTLLLIFAFVLAVYSIYVILFSNYPLNLYLPSWYSWYSVSLEVIYIGALIAVWFWKRIGIYAIVIKEVISLIEFSLIPKVILTPVTESILSFLTALIYLFSFTFIILFILAVKRKWGYFK